MMEYEDEYDYYMLLLNGICEEIEDLLCSTNHDVDDIDYVAFIVNEDCIDDEEIECLGEMLVEETDFDLVVRGVCNVDYNELVVGLKFHGEYDIITNLGNLEV